MTKKSFILILASILSGIIITYLPVTKGFFISDDYRFLLFAREQVHVWDSIRNPMGGHFFPFFRLSFLLQYNIFKLNAGLYHWISIFIHVINTVFTVLLALKLFKNRSIAIISGLLFSISTSHYRAITWVTIQMHLLSATWFLSTILLFLTYIEKRQNRYLFLSSACHLLMLFTSSYGFEMPIGLLLLLWALQKGQSTTRDKLSFRTGMFTLPYFFNIIIYFLIRRLFSAGAEGGEENLFVVTNLFHNSLTGVKYVAGAVYFRFLRSLTGSYIFHFNNPLLEAGYVSFVMVVLGILLDKSPSGIRRYSRYVFSLMAWIFMIYFPPAFFRQFHDFQWFINTPRYAYMPGPWMSILFALVLTSLCPLTNNVKKKKIAYGFLTLYLLGIVCANFFGIQKNIQTINYLSQNFKKIQDRFIYQITKICDDFPQIQLIDSVIVHNYAAWNVSTQRLAKIYLADKIYTQIFFLNALNAPTADKNVPTFFVLPSGDLKRIPTSRIRIIPREKGDLTNYPVKIYK